MAAILNLGFFLSAVGKQILRCEESLRNYFMEDTDMRYIYLSCGYGLQVIIVSIK